MNNKKTSCGSVCVSHIVGLGIAAAVICAGISMMNKKPQTIADKAKKAFKTIEDTLSV